MTEITQQNLHSFCRTCLVELRDTTTLMEEKYNIQENELEELINLCASYKITEELKFPEFVCGICYEKLQSLQEFRFQARESLEQLSNICRRHIAGPALSDGGQASQVKEIASEIKVKDCGELGPTQAFTHQPFKIEICENVPMMSDIKMEPPSEYVDDSFDYLHSATDATNTSQGTSPIYDAIYHNSSDYAQSNEELSTDIVHSESKSKPSSHTTKRLPSRTNAEKYLRCTQCERVFTSQDNYKVHMRTHRGLRPYECDVCGQGFSRSDRMLLHRLEVHSSDPRRYVCEYEGCDKTFRRKDTYQRHRRCKHRWPQQQQVANTKKLHQALWHSLFTA